MSHCRDHRQRTFVNGLRHLRFIEAPQILHGAPAPPHYEHIASVFRIGFSYSGSNLFGRPLSLYGSRV